MREYYIEFIKDNRKLFGILIEDKYMWIALAGAIDTCPDRILQIADCVYINGTHFYYIER